jgi:hypothetical protein
MIQAQDQVETIVLRRPYQPVRVFPKALTGYRFDLTPFQELDQPGETTVLCNLQHVIVSADGVDANS